MREPLVDHWIELLQGRLRLDIRYFTLNSVILFALSAVRALSSFVLSLAYARLISKEVYGQYVFIMALVGFFSLFSLPGMEAAIIRSAALGREGILKRGVKKVFTASLVGSCGLLLSSLYYLLVKPATPLFLPLVIAAALFPFYQACNQWQYLVMGKKQFLRLFLSYSFFSVVQPAVLIFTMWKFPSILPLLTVTLALQTLVFGLQTMRLIRESNTVVEESDLYFGKKISFARALQQGSVYVDSLILALFLGFEAVAVYQFAVIFPNSLYGLSKHLRTLALPKLTQLKEELIGKEFSYRIMQFVAVSLVACLTYVVFSPLLFRFAFPAYLSSLRFSQVYSAILLFVPFTMITALFESRGRSYEYSAVVSSSSLVRILLLFVLTWQFGLWGAIASGLISRFFSFVYGYFMFTRTYSDRIERQAFSIQQMREIAQKNKGRGRGLVYYYSTRFFSIYITKFLYYLSVQPQSVTLTALLLSIAASIFNIVNGRLVALAGLLIYAAIIADKVDGELARLYGAPTRKGKLLDLLFHFFNPSWFYFSLAIQHSGRPLLMIPLILYGLGLLFAFYFRVLYEMITGAPPRRVSGRPWMRLPLRLTRLNDTIPHLFLTVALHYFSLQYLMWFVVLTAFIRWGKNLLVTSVSLKRLSV